MQVQIIEFHQSPSTVSSSDGSLYILLSLFFLCLSHKYLKLKVNQAHGEKRRTETTTSLLFCSSVSVPKYLHPHRVKWTHLCVNKLAKVQSNHMICIRPQLCISSSLTRELQCTSCIQQLLIPNLQFSALWLHLFWDKAPPFSLGLSEALGNPLFLPQKY